MNIEWTDPARNDLNRLYAFLVVSAPEAAAHILEELSKAPVKLLEYPRRGARVERYTTRETRRMNVGNYKLHMKFAVTPSW